MSDPTSIFNGQSQETPATQNTQQGVPPAQPNDDLSTLLGAIRNERGEQKYRTVHDALTALQHSQEYIPELSQKLKQQEQELAEAKAAAAKVSELEQIVLTLAQEKNKPSQETPTQTGLDPSQVEELISKTLTKRQQEEKAKENVASVTTAVRQAFGEKAEEVFYGRAAELGMSQEQFNTLAATTPKAVLKLLGLEAKVPQGFQSTTSSINTAGMSPRQESYIGRNSKPMLVGATFDDLRQENINARKMVDELHAQGKEISSITSYSEYKKHFLNK